MRAGGVQVSGPQFFGIQSLRLAAALLVVVTHSLFYANDRLDPNLPLWSVGTIGVDIFFTISGFVMMITAPPFERAKGGWRYFGMRRIVRIVPLYWIATTLKIATIAIVPTVAINSELNWQHVVSSYFFVPSYNQSGDLEPVLGVGWTLVFEMFFYLVFAIGLMLRTNVYFFTSAIMVALAAASFLRQPEWPAAAFYLDPIVICFVIGMTVAKIVRLRRATTALVSAAFGLAVIVAVLVVITGGGAWDNRFFRMPVVALILVLVVWGEPVLAQRLPRPVVFLGDASYSLYLFHPLIAPVVPTVLAILGLRLGAVSVLGSITASLVAATVIYLLIERPLTRRLRALPFAGRLPSPHTSRPVAER